MKYCAKPYWRGRDTAPVECRPSLAYGKNKIADAIFVGANAP